MESTLIHPIYYVDFSKLGEIVTSNANWKDVFCRVFADQQMIRSDLKKLENLRNRVAHNRPCFDSDLTLAESILNSFVSQIGLDRAISLLSNSHEYVSISERLHSLRQELQEFLSCLSPDRQFPDTRAAVAASQSWWLADELLPLDSAPIIEAIELCVQFGQLPRGYGTAHLAQRFLDSDQLKGELSAAISQLEAAIEPEGSRNKSGNAKGGRWR